MSKERLIQNAAGVVAEATQRQQLASDPMASAWVGASAGSGKTKVLTDRILRLLLPREDGQPGSKPEKILALTFTKAAANEMSLRLSKRLSEWAIMDEDKLIKNLHALLGKAPSPDTLDEARSLFARVVDTPGGLKIMTIHSFCQSTLSRFPLEAGLMPGFKSLEEAEAQEILLRAQKSILAHAEEQPHTPIAEAVSFLAKIMDAETFSSLIGIMVRERRQLQDILKSSFGIDGLYTNLCTRLMIKHGTSPEQELVNFCKYNEALEVQLRSVLTIAFESDKAKDLKLAQALKAYLDADIQDRPKFYPVYKSTFIKTDGTSYKDHVTAFVKTLMPDAPEILSREADRILSHEEGIKSLRTALHTRDLFLIGAEIAKTYQAMKQAQGALDFDDLILSTLSLLKGETIKESGKDISSWVMYKLDEGLDHILVDEAQDTNPEQWEIIRLLADDFFSGLGAKEDSLRTLFVVGDDKQSIFGFQRAAPEKFDQMRTYFSQKIAQARQDFRKLDISTSFRSVEAILAAVDMIFVDGKNSLGTAYLHHIAKRQGQAGHVEIWPILSNSASSTDEPQESPQADDKGWNVPDEIHESQSGSSKMASKIGDTIENWLLNREVLQAYGRPIQPGDIMVLVRSRGPFVNQLVSTLKSRNIPVSGVDRMTLSEEMVVQDLCMAASFALLPDDDLSLACLLKSPLIGFSEEELYELCQGRRSSLWKSIQKFGDARTIEWLSQLIASAGKHTPYDFFSNLIQSPCPSNPYNGMHAIRIRLGEDALDPLDEFLSAALTYEKTHSAGLQEFLFLQQGNPYQIKRELEEGGNAVRIMTVHGAKGLQSPIVFLPDTVRTSSSVKPDKILWPEKTGEYIPLYVSSNETMPQAIMPLRKSIEDRMDEEYRRLLYVAMTRAEERLYIGGYVGQREPSEEAKTVYWYKDIRSAFEKDGRVKKCPSGIVDKNGQDVPILKLTFDTKELGDKIGDTIKSKQENTITTPAWLHTQAPADSAPVRPLTPSRPSEVEPAAISPLAENQLDKFKRGTITHRLLQTLPDIPIERRLLAAQKYLARKSLDLSQDDQGSIALEVMTVLENPIFFRIFGPNSMAEIPISGLLPDGRLISGQIDRIVVLENEILLVDYKTNRPPPDHLEGVPLIYRNQMKAYADTLKAIYPDHRIKAALLWTYGARLMEIPV